MKVKVGGPLSHMWTNGLIESWTGAVLDVPDDDAERVGYFRQLAAAGDAEVIEDVAKAEPPEVANKVATNEELRDELRDRGLPVSGNKDELTERLADDEAQAAAAAKPARKSTAAKAANDE